LYYLQRTPGGTQAGECARREPRPRRRSQGCFMIEDRGSRTAVQQAAIRAVESLQPPEKRVCYDPLAIVFLDDRLQRRYRLALKNKFQRRLWIWSVRKDPGGTRAEGVARTKYIDDYSQACISKGGDTGGGL
jgi:O-methyltransferase involved in polyketide biosynthesis